MMTEFIVSDDQWTYQVPTENGLVPLHLPVNPIEHAARRICSRISAYFFQAISKIRYRSNILTSVHGSSFLVRVSYGLSLLIDPELPEYPLMADQYAADMPGGELS